MRRNVLLAPSVRARSKIPGNKTNGGPGEESTFIDLGDSVRLALMLTPKSQGSFREQAEEVFATAQSVLQRQVEPMVMTAQTLFLREPGDRLECERILAAHYGEKRPVTNFVLQAPCSGAALAMEAWAIGGKSVRVEHYGPDTLAVSYDSVRWVYCSGIQPANGGVYAQTKEALERMQTQLARAGSGFQHVVRTWFYLGGITDNEGGTQRYRELNRARADFYHDIPFCGELVRNGRRISSPRQARSGDAGPGPGGSAGVVYPASTGIGMWGEGLAASCMTLQTGRKDAFVLALENPQQTPAYAYPASCAPQSPKFSRAMALALGHYLTIWVSGTASIVDAESRHEGDIEKQTEQTIDNIERLIAQENFAAHGVKNAGAGLHDFAKIRVYLKHREDFQTCRAICERRFGAVPAIYAVADICRPELLVEIEGVAFAAR